MTELEKAKVRVKLAEERLSLLYKEPDIAFARQESEEAYKELSLVTAREAYLKVELKIINARIMNIKSNITNFDFPRVTEIKGEFFFNEIRILLNTGELRLDNNGLRFIEI